MDWIKKQTKIIDHPKLLAAGAVGRDLWDWGLLYSGEHELDGELPMVAVLASAWGSGGKSNIKVAEKLVAVGLWERTDLGYRSLKWAEMGNLTKAQLAASREAARERINKKRSQSVRANTQRTSPDVPTSTSYSSGSGSREGVQGEDAPDSGPTPPDWFRSVLSTIEMNTGERLEAGASWLRYRGHRANKTVPMGVRDAEYWLTSVIVPELKRDRAFKREREDRKRLVLEGPPRPPPPTREQAEKFAEELASRVRAARAAGGSR